MQFFHLKSLLYLGIFIVCRRIIFKTEGNLHVVKFVGMLLERVNESQRKNQVSCDFICSNFIISTTKISRPLIQWKLLLNVSDRRGTILGNLMSHIAKSLWQVFRSYKGTSHLSWYWLICRTMIFPESRATCRAYSHPPIRKVPMTEK